ncbi:MAG: hypothetical protein ACRD72_20435, partial [Candidatus Angelobacter sp.]
GIGSGARERRNLARGGSSKEVCLQKESALAGAEGKPTKNPRGGQARNLPAKGNHISQLEPSGINELQADGSL